MIVKYFDVADSSQDLAKAEVDSQEDTLIIVGRQKGGRGRYGRSFFSPPGGLYFSWTFLTDKPVHQLTTPMVAAVCARKLSYMGRETQIKWVNDIFFEGKKVAGILTQAFKKERTYRIVIGVGLNLYIDFDSLNEEIRGQLPYMGHLDLKLNLEERKKLALDIVWDIKKELDILYKSSNEKDEMPTILKEYDKRLLGRGREAFLSDGSKGIIRGIDNQAGLIIEDQGRIRHIKTGEISILKEGPLWQKQ